MHSVREMCGTDDVAHSYAHMHAFYKHFTEVDKMIAVDDA
jgi:aspartyl aminopeptidase